MFVIPISDRLKDLREEKGLTQHQLSCDSGLPGNAIFRIESGNIQKTSHFRAQAIAKALGCKVDDIFIIPSRSGQKAATNK